MGTEGDDLLIVWNDRDRLPRLLRAAGGIPVHGHPHALRCPGGKVAVMQADRVALVFNVARIRGPENVRLANGSRRENGYVLVARRGSIRPPTGDEADRFAGFPTEIEGRFGYIDYKTGERTFVGPPPPIPPHRPARRRPPKIHHLPFHGGIHGLPRNHPEARLVDAYVEWVNEEGRFGQDYLPGPKFYTDLFDRRYRRLIEAKASADRKDLRMAVGQLLDYKVFYPKRKPGLGILVPQKPTPSALKFLWTYRIAAIWETPTGRFRDSREGRWTVRNR